MREELHRRFGDAASIEYVNLDDPASSGRYVELTGKIQDAGLLLPATFIDGEAVYDGAVSYPAILRQVESRLGGAA